MILYMITSIADDLFYYNLLFSKLRFGGYGTLDLALGTFGTFTSWGIRQFLIVIFRLLLVLVYY